MSYINNLIQRLSDDSLVPGESLSSGMLYESSKTISWAAHEEARELNKIDYIDELQQLLKFEKDKDRKKNIIFILGHLAKNTGRNEIANTLIEQLKTEKDKFTIIATLHRLEEIYKDKSVDLTTIYKLCDHKNWHIRSSAYAALTNTEHEIESFLIQKAKATEGKDDLLYLLRSITKIGTIKAIETTESLMKHRSRDVKENAAYTTAIIMLRENFSFEEIRKRTKLKDGTIEAFKNKLDKYTI